MKVYIPYIDCLGKFNQSCSFKNHMIPSYGKASFDAYSFDIIARTGWFSHINMHLYIPRCAYIYIYTVHIPVWLTFGLGYDMIVDFSKTKMAAFSKQNRWSYLALVDLFAGFHDFEPILSTQVLLETPQNEN